MIEHINENELNTRIALNFKRLRDSSYYQIGEVFAPAEYGWPADKEGRALLSYVSHYKISGKKIPCMDKMIEKAQKDGFNIRIISAYRTYEYQEKIRIDSGIKHEKFELFLYENFINISF